MTAITTTTMMVITIMIPGADLGILRGGGGVRAQVHGNFHILTRKKQQPLGGGGLNPLTPLDPPLYTQGI